MSLLAMLPKEAAVTEVSNLVQKKNSAYHLLPFHQYRQGKKLRSKRYEAFHVLCFTNTFKQAGWLVCNYALHGNCKLEQSLLTFHTTKGETGCLERHVAQQEIKTKTTPLPKQIPHFSKAVISRCAATMAVALDLRPISFTGREEGLSHFVDSIFRAGQATAVSDCIDTKSILLCSKTVAKALIKLADDNRQAYRALLPDMIAIGGAVTMEGVMLKIQDKQFYDSMLHVIETLNNLSFESTPRFIMRCKTLLLQEKTEAGDAEQFRSMLGLALKNYYGCDMDTLTKGFTMVSDNASVILFFLHVDGCILFYSIGQFGQL